MVLDDLRFVSRLRCKPRSNLVMASRFTLQLLIMRARSAVRLLDVVQIRCSCVLPIITIQFLCMHICEFKNVNMRDLKNIMLKLPYHLLNKGFVQIAI